MDKLDDKVAIVTGAARGLGHAYAKRLAGLGATVAVADLNLRSYEEFEAEAKDMTGHSTVDEIEAAGGAAIGIEVDVRDQEGVEAMVARVVEEWGRVDVLVANAGRGSWSARGHQGQHPRSGAFATRDGNEPVRDRLLVQRGRADHEAATFREDHHGKLGRGDRTVRGWRLRPLRRGEGCYRPLHAVSGPGSRAVRDYGELYRARRDRHRRIVATVIPGSIQSNRDRAELVALRRLGTVEDCAKVVEFLATDLSDYVTGAVIPIDGGLG